MGARQRLAPYMDEYDDFVDRSHTRWLPYLMYFSRTDFRSRAINTDRLGFRLTHGPAGEVAGLGEDCPPGPVSLLVGSSTAFGVGTTCDAATIPSLLWSKYAPSTPWLNFGSRGYNSTQELLLYVLHRADLPVVRRVVIFSGLNNVALAGLPKHLHSEYGAFFFSGEYYQQMNAVRSRRGKENRGVGALLKSILASDTPTVADEQIPSVDERIATAVRQTRRDLQGWQAVLGPNVELSFALQPLATWTRAQPTPEEAELFDELDGRGSTFWKLFGDIAQGRVGSRYSAEIAAVCREFDIPFVDMNTRIAAADDEPNRWMFVDRAHFVDDGYDLVTRELASALSLA